MADTETGADEPDSLVGAVEAPAAYDADERAAFRTGFRAAMQIVHSASGTYLHALDTDGARDSSPADGDGSASEPCDECGATLIEGLGGPVCPRCET